MRQLPKLCGILMDLLDQPSTLSPLPTPFLVCACSSQLPPSHPAAPPEHLKEPLAYMRKAQVSLSLPVSITLPPSLSTSVILLFIIGLLNSEIWPIFYHLGICNTVSEDMCVCVCSFTQASWEKRILKSLNSMCTELGVPLARMVPKMFSISAKNNDNSCHQAMHLSSYFDISRPFFSQHCSILSLGRSKFYFSQGLVKTSSALLSFVSNTQ